MTRKEATVKNRKKAATRAAIVAIRKESSQNYPWGVLCFRDDSPCRKCKHFYTDYKGDEFCEAWDRNYLTFSDICAVQEPADCDFFDARK